MNIFIDAMGGDRAPQEVLSGTLMAAAELKAALTLFGPEHVLQPWASSLKKKKLKASIDWIHCSETIEMHESPTQAIRTKKQSSIVQGLRRTLETQDSAFFSAGHSGAIFAAALFTLGRIANIERPAIATPLPTLINRFLLLDAGANVDCRPSHFLDWASMGATYAHLFFKKENPTIGLLSNGEEDSKGTDLTRAAHQLLKEKQHFGNYVGYIEGKEIFQGKIDVVLTDGFTGNVVLKCLEGLGKSVSHILKTEFKRNWFTKIGFLFSIPALIGLQKKLDYSETGGAPLLGVQGNCFIGHGSSNAKAIKNGILKAAEAISLDLVQQIQRHHDIN